jgi:hypothetical protein
LQSRDQIRQIPANDLPEFVVIKLAIMTEHKAIGLGPGWRQPGRFAGRVRGRAG